MRAALRRRRGAGLLVCGHLIVLPAALTLLTLFTEPARCQPAASPEQPPDRDQVQVSEIPLTKQVDDEKRLVYVQDIILDNGLRRFGLHKAETLYKPATVPSHHVGWNAPDQANWYHSNMFDLLLNGQSVNTGKSTFTVLESGPRGVTDFTLDNEFGKFRCRFVVIPNSEVLFTEFAVEPAVEVKSLVLKLHNYPGGFAVPREGKRHRQVLSVGGTLEPRAEPYTLSPAVDWWLFYQDRYLDKDIPENRERAYGPSALVLPGGQARQVRVTVGDYEVPTEIEYPPDARHFRLAFLDYFGLGNKPAQARFAQERDQARATLEGLVFIPQRLRQAQAILPQIKADGLTGEAAATVPELKQLLGALPGGDPWPQEPVSTEARALQLLDLYDKARWVVVKKQRPRIGILVLRGLHWRFWGLAEAENTLGGLLREQAVSHYAEYYWRGEDITYFPATWEEMSRFDVVVFANVPFTVLGSGRAQALAEFVQAGGAVLLLGGTHAFGQGGIDEPPLGPLMPVQPTRVFDLLRFEEAQPLIRTKEAPSWLSAVDLEWKAAPAALWCQQIQPAPTGKVWLTTGGRPFLIVGSAGAGRVAGICAPPYGEPARRDTGFWQWPSWPTLMAKLLLWLGTGNVPPLPRG